MLLLSQAVSGQRHLQDVSELYGFLPGTVQAFTAERATELSKANCTFKLTLCAGFKHARLKDWWVAGLWWQRKAESELIWTTLRLWKGSRSCSPKAVSGGKGWSCSAEWAETRQKRMGKLWWLRKVFKFSVFYQCYIIFRLIWNKCFLVSVCSK